MHGEIAVNAAPCGPDRYHGVWRPPPGWFAIGHGSPLARRWHRKTPAVDPEMKVMALEPQVYGDFETIVLQERPLIDVRAPVEFEKGAFRNACNLPLMGDEERHRVGKCYKEYGRVAAIALGHRLVSGEQRRERVQAWLCHLKHHPDSLLYCFRGGLRSQLVQQWVRDAQGRAPLRLQGGYKAFRNYLLGRLAPEAQVSLPVILGGFTGAGKTKILRQFQHSVDLEQIANHRGSAFGQQVSPQPTQIQFENDLAYALIQHRHRRYRFLLLEDEGNHVGKRFIPRPLVTYFQGGAFVFVEAPLQERIDNTFNEYVLESQAAYREAFGEQGLGVWADYVRRAMGKLRKRLGNQRCSHMLAIFESAFAAQRQSADKSSHRHWIEKLLVEYYDPMYQYQVRKKRQEAVFRGSPAEVLEFLQYHYPDTERVSLDAVNQTTPSVESQ